MDLGRVDRITADAVGEPGSRTFYLQAKRGDELVTMVVEKQQVQLLATSILELLSDLELETGTGPDDEQMGLEDLVEPRWHGEALHRLRPRPRALRPGDRGVGPRRRKRGRVGRPSLARAGARDDPAFCDARADVRAVPIRRGGHRARPADLSVLREPDGPGGTRVPRDERPLGARVTDPNVPSAIETGVLEILGLLPNSSNYTFLARATGPDGAQELAVYKRNEASRPLGLPAGLAVQARGGGLRRRARARMAPRAADRAP